MLRNNIKIHFAGSDNVFNANAALKIAEVNYRLYTCYPFIVNKKVTDDLRLKPDAPLQFGYNRTSKGSYHINQNKQEIREKFMEQAKLLGVKEQSLPRAADIAIAALLNKLDYQSVAGSQD